MGHWLIWLLRRAIRIYQVVISPLLGPRCRFYPTCSHYALKALSEHGAYRGSSLSLRRLGRCRPWGGQGYDPVPPSLVKCGPFFPLNRARQQLYWWRPPYWNGLRGRIPLTV